MLNNTAYRDDRRVDRLPLAIVNQDLARRGEDHEVPQARSLLTSLNLRVTAMQRMKCK